jgi:hypothetical protein
MKAKIRKQAQEISYIAIRLAQLTNNQELADRIEKACLAIIEGVYGQKYLNSIENTEVLEGIIAYGVNTSQITIDNGEELIKRTVNLKDLLIEGHSTTEERFKIEATLAMLPEPHKRGKGQSGNTTAKLPDGKTRQGPKANQRQGKIVELLRQKGKLQLKEIINSFPEISERTVRYDLTHLCDEKKIIREGNGGPANFYMIPSSLAKTTLKSSNLPEIPATEPQIQAEDNNIGPSPLELPKTELNELFNPPL